MTTVTGRFVNKGALMKMSQGKVTSIFQFQFNPSERDMSRSPAYLLMSPPGSFEPDAYFGFVSGSRFTLRLLLDATVGYDSNKQGTRAHKAWIEQFTQPDIDQYLRDPGRYVEPPEMRYSMGGRGFKVRVMSTRFQDVRFNTFGYETRTWVNLELQTIYEDEAQKKAHLLWLQQMAKQVEVKPG